MKAQVAGKYQLTVLRLDGSIKAQTPWFDNLITNTGLDIFGGVGSTGTLTAQVGSGTTPPAETDTAIETLVAATTSSSSADTTQYTTSPYWGRRRYTFTFAIGAIQTTISEVVIRLANLFSRALITNESGEPTTLTLGAIDQLILTYDLYVYFVGVQEFEFDVNGVTRSTQAMPGALGIHVATISVIGGINNSFPSLIRASGIGSVGSINYSGSEATLARSAAGSYAYSSGTYFRDFYAEFSAESGAFSGANGLRLIQFSSGPTLNFKTFWSPAFDKTNLETVRLEGRFAWGRYVP